MKFDFRILYYKYKSLNIAVKAALWFTICNFLQKGIAFITIPIFTRLMSTQEYGVYSLYVSWLQVFTVISSLYIYNGVSDNAMSKFPDDRDKFISSMLGLSLTITTSLLVMAIISWESFCALLGLPSVLVILMLAELYVTPSFSYWICKQRFEYRYKQLVLVTMARSILNPVIGLLAVYYMQDKSFARIASIVFVEYVVCGTLLIYQFTKGRVFFSKKYWSYSLGLAVPILPHYLSGVLLNHGDKIMIAHFIDSHSLALYSLAYSIGMVAQVFVKSINSATTPWIYKMLKASNIIGVKERSKALLFLVAVICFMMMLLAPEAVMVFGSSQYAKAAVIIPPVATSVFFIYLYSFLTFPEFFYEKTKFLMVSSVFSAVLNVILNYAFLPIYGYSAAAYTTMFCYGCYAIFHYIFGKRILNMYSQYSSILDEKFAIYLSGMLVFSGIVFPTIYGATMVRYSLLFGIIMIGCIKRRTVLAIIKIHR